MKYFIQCLFVTLLLILSCSQSRDTDQMLADFFNHKKAVTILVTDSGLGGLSVAADVASRLPQSGVFESAKIVFFNSLFHNRSGYNSLDSEAEKVRIFETALQAMDKKHHPDLLLIACNTLSVLYDKTKFSKQTNYPVIGIVETGVDLIARAFDENPEAAVLIFATKTTIGSNTHRDLLIDKGYESDKIIGQPCHRLAGAIERGYNSDETKDYIIQYVAEALSKLSDLKQPIFASLNCTHYGYSMQPFKEVFAALDYPDIKIIDPNPEMANFIFNPAYVHRFPETSVTVEVVSKVKISDKKRSSLAQLLQITSPPTAEALHHYKYDPDLFDAKFDSTTIQD